MGIFEDTLEGYNEHKDFTSLICWKNCKEVKLFFYKQIIPRLPPEEKHNLGIQIRRSARSITANIAEGVGRFHYQEAIQFLRISRGSLSELKDDLITCKDLEYLDEKLYNEGLELIENAKRTLNGFINFNIRQKSGNK